VIRRVTFAIALGVACAAVALPQENAGKFEPTHEVEQHDQWIWWKWANFAILAGGLGYMIRKNAPAFFAQRSQAIDEGLRDAAKQKKDAEVQAAAIEQRLAGLQHEIDNLRTTARAEMTAEGERIGRETENRLRRIQDQAAQEIALMTRATRGELRRYSAQLAIDLAEQRIRSHIDKDAQDGLVDAFLQDLRRRPTPGASARV